MRDELEQLAGALARRSALSTPRIFRQKATLSTHGQMRKQRVALEHHRRAALGRRQVGDVLRRRG